VTDHINVVSNLVRARHRIRRKRRPRTTGTTPGPLRALHHVRDGYSEAQCEAMNPHSGKPSRPCMRLIPPLRPMEHEGARMRGASRSQGQRAHDYGARLRSITAHLRQTTVEVNGEATRERVKENAGKRATRKENKPQCESFVLENHERRLGSRCAAPTSPRRGQRRIRREWSSGPARL